MVSVFNFGVQLVNVEKGKYDMYIQGVKVGEKFDLYSQGVKVGGKFDLYSEGVNKKDVFKQ